MYVCIYILNINVLFNTGFYEVLNKMCRQAKEKAKGDAKPSSASGRTENRKVTGEPTVNEASDARFYEHLS